MNRATLMLAALTLLSGGVGPTARAGAILTGNYYSVPNNNSQDPDFQSSLNGGAGMVQNQLGPDGLPVVSSYGATMIHMTNSLGEILWWTPSSQYGIQFLGQVNTSIPINNPDMYVSNFPNNFSNGNANDSTNFLTAMFTGTFNAQTPGTYTFNSGSDDDTWVFIDGTLVVDNGGIHGPTDVTTQIPLSAGSHTIDIFYADRHTVGAVFQLTSFDDPNGNPVNLQPSATVPEPTSLVVFGTVTATFAGYFGWRRRKQPVAG